MIQDGRLIDSSLGTLQGEGSHQISEGRDHTSFQAPAIFEPRDTGPTYYERPLLQKPVWKLSIPLYFYTGGLAGASAALGLAAQVLGGGELRRLVTRCRWIGAAGAAVSAVFLIDDLGRPARFLYMLRVFRPTSPMNVGTWILAPFGSAAGVAAITANAAGPGLRRIGDLGAWKAGLLGLPLASYTGVLLANTAVPLWQGARRTLPLLFVSSAVTSVAALLEVMTLSEQEEKIVDTFAIVGGLAELTCTLALERELAPVEIVGRPLRQGLPAVLWQTSRACSAVSLVLSLFPGKSRKRRLVSGVIGTAASLCLRIAIVEAGKRSAVDPRASFRQQREGGK